MSNKLKSILIVLPFLVLAGTIWLRGISGSPEITVRNNSPSAISKVVLSGDGWNHSVPAISPGNSATVVVHPTGESGLRISFLSAGKEITKDDLAYIESSGGYCVTVTIGKNLNITADDNSGCFSLKRAIVHVDEQEAISVSLVWKH